MKTEESKMPMNRLLTLDQLRPIGHSRVVTVRVGDVFPLIEALESQRDEAVALLREWVHYPSRSGAVVALDSRTRRFLRDLASLPTPEEKP